jgi:hypothetical protein
VIRIITIIPTTHRTTIHITIHTITHTPTQVSISITDTVAILMGTVVGIGDDGKQEGRLLSIGFIIPFDRSRRTADVQ